MSDRKTQFLTQVVATILSRVASGDIREARMKFTGNRIQSFEIPVWIEVLRYESREKGREMLHARTNDIDLMVTAAPSFWVDAELDNPETAVSAVVDHLSTALGRHDRIDFLTDGRDNDNQPLQVLVGDSETGVEGIRPQVIPDLPV